MRPRFVGQQPFTRSAESALGQVQKRFYRVLTIVLAMLLTPGWLMLPAANAQAESARGVGVGALMVLASKPMKNTTAQLPSNLATQLRQALSKQTNIPAAKLKIVEATPKTWTNGCLDLARSDEICTQAIVKGWRVVFSNSSQRWIYRTDQQGRLYRLEP
ncbi:hypothetical protein [Stenomitos frigidus]|uniref:Uncharacterized protein n=1 Tax=Stenomitos frigidus ULC18 TaxID=2107698 RepID=A0A2T1EIY5_9CYAN|nr:hypothetical protein [Stenomitos frigidus]PSB32651.1 hypothetical protein C7B82_05220 [Stenomitos frigidus ULC18]